MYILRVPLNHLLKKNVKWNWFDHCQKAFVKLKTAFNFDAAQISKCMLRATQVILAWGQFYYKRRRWQTKTISPYFEDSASGGNELFADRKSFFLYH